MPVGVQRLMPLWFRVENTAEAPQLQFEGHQHPCRGAEADFHGLAVQKTIETPLLLLNTVIDVPVAQFLQVRTSFIVPCIWQSLVRCLVFACGVQDYGLFWETTSGTVSVCNTPWFDSGYMFGVSLRGLLEDFTRFIREGGTPFPEVDFCSPCKHGRREVAALVVNGSCMYSIGLLVSTHFVFVFDVCRQGVAALVVNGSGMHSTGLLVSMHLALCSRRLPTGRLLLCRSCKQRQAPYGR